jgi:hypothetical protein
MHQEFADWYRRVHIDPKSVHLQKRWQAIEAFHQKATAYDLADATRIFFKLSPKDKDFLAMYRAEFKAADDEFSMLDNDAELQVLAGATLANHFDHHNERSILTSLFVVCATCQGARKAPIPEIVKLAGDTLQTHSSSLRASRKKLPLPSLDVNEKLQDLTTTLSAGGANFQSLHGPLTGVLQPLVQAVSAITNWATRVSRIEELRQEESDVLWWLFGESSRDLGVPFGNLKKPSACIIGAKEFADLTGMLPGPYGVEAYLHKMLTLADLDPNNAVSLSDAAFACPGEWQKQFVMLQLLETVIDLCPVHLAIQKCTEAGGKKTAWHVPFQTASGLKAGLKAKPIGLALQTYRERLLVRTLNHLQETKDE